MWSWRKLKAKRKARKNWFSKIWEIRTNKSHPDKISQGGQISLTALFFIHPAAPFQRTSLGSSELIKSPVPHPIIISAQGDVPVTGFLTTSPPARSSAGTKWIQPTCRTGVFPVLRSGKRENIAKPSFLRYTHIINFLNQAQP
jgi:hypothetical protein